MSRKRRSKDYVGNELYRTHMPGVGHAIDPARERKEIITRFYERILIELCVNRFKWRNLPESVDARFLEMTLFYNGLSVFFYNEEYDRFMALRGNGVGNTNMYDNPTKFMVTGNQIMSKTLNSKQCVPIWANMTRTPDYDIVRIYAQRLAEIDRTAEINLLGARHPFVFSVGENERLSMVNAFRQVQEGQPVIFGTESMNPTNLAEKVNLFNLSLPKDVLSEMMEIKVKTWNEALTLLGIMNVNSEKRERMVVEEASGASGQVMGMRAIALNERRKACQMINVRYSLDVSVDWQLDQDVPSLEELAQ